MLRMLFQWRYHIKGVHVGDERMKQVWHLGLPQGRISQIRDQYCPWHADAKSRLSPAAAKTSES